MATTALGQMFGGSGFSGSAYCMHESIRGGATCAQACATMALSNLSHRGARVVGTYELTSMAGAEQDDLDVDDRCLSKNGPILLDADVIVQPVDSITIGGMLPCEMEDMLNLQGVSALSFAFDSHEEVLFERLIEAYLKAGLSSILYLDCKVLWDYDVTQEHEAHYVYLLGGSYEQETPTRERLFSNFIVHDPGRRPYVRHTRNTIIAAMKSHFTNGRMHMCFVADRNVKVHALDCIGHLKQSSSFRELWAHYEIGEGGSDFRVSLLDRDSIANILMAGDDLNHEPKRLLRAAWLEKIKHLPKTRFWVIEGLRNGSREVAWLFRSDVGTEEIASPHAFLEYTPAYEDSYVLVDTASSEPTVAFDDTFPERTTDLTVSNFNTKAILSASVLSSSSDLPLSKLSQHLANGVALRSMDLFLLRDRDIADIQRQHTDLPVHRAGFFENDACIDLAARWLFTRLQAFIEIGGRVAAYATYFPAIASVDSNDRNKAVGCLANAVCTAITLSKTNSAFPSCPIVEFVGGSSCDRCNCNSCNGRRVWRFDKDVKRKLLVHSLLAVRDIVERKMGKEEKFYLATELEPGFTYNIASQDDLASWCESLRTPELSTFVGLNLDLAHMVAAGVSPDFLRKNKELLIHSHIADLPYGMHTRDQAIGEWSPGCLDESDYWGLLSVLQERAIASNDSPLPFSRHVAIELEGCSRLPWIYRSVGTLREMLQGLIK